MPIGGKQYSLVEIPYNAASSTTFEPKVTKVVIGVNNTVRWVNKDTVPTWIEADNNADPNFYNATKDTSSSMHHLQASFGCVR